jgi:hypothetical protein
VYAGVSTTVSDRSLNVHKVTRKQDSPCFSLSLSITSAYFISSAIERILMKFSEDNMPLGDVSQFVLINSLQLAVAALLTHEVARVKWHQR